VPDAVRASIVIEAQPEEIYDYFTRSEAMVLWMGQYASLDPRPGGEFAVDVNDAPIRGRYLELEPPNRLVFSWGVAGSDVLPAGSSTVEVCLTEEAAGTRVEIFHSGLPLDERDKHGQGWRHFLGRLASSVEDGPATFA
jgi:uncharacterized protein YndB with AHSA1/START domain